MQRETSNGRKLPSFFVSYRFMISKQFSGLLTQNPSIITQQNEEISETDYQNIKRSKVTQVIYLPRYHMSFSLKCNINRKSSIYYVLPQLILGSMFLFFVGGAIPVYIQDISAIVVTSCTICIVMLIRFIIVHYLRICSRLCAINSETEYTADSLKPALDSDIKSLVAIFQQNSCTSWKRDFETNHVEYKQFIENVRNQNDDNFDKGQVVVSTDPVIVDIEQGNQDIQRTSSQSKNYVKIG